VYINSSHRDTLRWLEDEHGYGYIIDNYCIYFTFDVDMVNVLLVSACYSL
jgi:hypothetical protein